MSNYQPPYSCLHLLGPVAAMFAAGRVNELHQRFHGAHFIGTCPGGELFFESNLELDTDGSTFHKQDKTGQSGTALSGPGGKGVDANAVPFIVLPLRSFGHWGINLGDMAMVIHNGRMSAAIFADRGPEDKLGEGSIELHRRLGYERIHQGILSNRGITGRVLTFVFPRSGTHKTQPVQAIEAVSKQRWRQMASEQASLQPGHVSTPVSLG